jgi:hypothetical protein
MCKLLHIDGFSEMVGLWRVFLDCNKNTIYFAYWVFLPYLEDVDADTKLRNVTYVRNVALSHYGSVSPVCV